MLCYAMRCNVDWEFRSAVRKKRVVRPCSVISSQILFSPVHLALMCFSYIDTLPPGLRCTAVPALLSTMLTISRVPTRTTTAVLRGATGGRWGVLWRAAVLVVLVVVVVLGTAVVALAAAMALVLRGRGAAVAS
jgi:hypothetical protein